MKQSKARYAPMLNLKRKRIEKELTQAQLAEMVGIKQSLLSNYETGVYFPRRKVLDKLAKALDCEVRDIV